MGGGGRGARLAGVSEPLILGIESTCDETGAALVRGRELLGDAVATSMDAYARFGGIVPEIASRAHLESFVPTLDSALDRAGADLSDVDAVAVCAGPGLIGSLTVGISAAKALAVALDVPIYGVNHVVGHLAVDELVDDPLPERFIGLVVSGGHSTIVLVGDIATDVVELGGTLDDGGIGGFHGGAQQHVVGMNGRPCADGLHGDAAGDLPGGMAAHSVAHGEHGGLDKEGILVVSAHQPDVRARTPGDARRGPAPGVTALATLQGQGVMARTVDGLLASVPGKHRLEVRPM